MGTSSWQVDEDRSVDPEQANLYRQARQRVHMRFTFYYHFTIYLIVIAGLLVLDILNGTDHFFVQWVAGGWGIGIAAHFLSAFTLDGLSVQKPSAAPRTARCDASRTAAAEGLNNKMTTVTQITVSRSQQM